MWLFDLFKKKPKELSDEDLKWNKMWDLWAEEKAESPYAELMLYESEVNNGGHAQFFDNVSNTGDLPTTVERLYTVLPPELRSSLERGYAAWTDAESGGDEERATEIMDGCDDLFYEKEEAVIDLLRGYAAGLSL